MKIRVATPADGDAVFDIYSHYIASSTATFEITQLTPESMAERIAHTLEGFPYLVCEEDDKIIGYSYAHPLGEREAFRYGAELAIYLHPQQSGRGAGTELYRRLIALLEKQGICNLYAAITAENEGSIQFHSHLGFAKVGHIPRAGYKFGRWLDLCWMAKALEHCGEPEMFIPFSQLETKEINQILEGVS